ncbi:5615_t:CDS:1, partial [Racocetra fulgida]
MPSQIPLQMSSQMPSQMPTNFSNFSLQPSTNFFSHYPNIPLQALPNISLYIPANFSPHLSHSISLQPYFIPFLILSNLSQGSLTTSSKYIPELEEFLTKIDKAENANGEILACLSEFQNQAIQ